MKIASILPYKENYTLRGAGAVALWISYFIRDSAYKKNIFIIGSTNNKNYLSKNYIHDVREKTHTTHYILSFVCLFPESDHEW